MPNTAPTDIIVTGGSISESNGPFTIAATLTATDPDAGDTFTFALTDTPASTLFEIKGNTIILTAGAILDYETATQHNLTVRVTDQAGNTYSEVVSIDVTDANEIDGTDPIDGNTLTGSDQDDIITGLDGDDLAFGNLGNDLVYGGGGADIIFNSGGNDTSYGGDGDDTIVDDAGSNGLYGGAGFDSLTGGGDVDILDGGADADVINGGGGNDRILVAAGDLVAGERITGGVGTDAIELGSGTHSFVGVTLQTVEQIKLTGATATTVTLGSAAQADLFVSSVSNNDTVILNGYLTPGRLITLANAGIEHVQFTNGNGTNVADFAGGKLTTMTITYLPSNTTLNSTVLTYDTSTASTFGVATQAVNTFDSSIIETATYVNGLTTQVQKTDGAGGTEYAWKSQLYTYNAAGTALASLMETADNNDTTYTTYDATSSTTTFTDVSNTRILSHSERTVDATGKPTFTSLTNDGGKVAELTYTSGILTKYEEKDLGSEDATYKTNVLEYSLTGVKTRQFLTQDDNDTYELNYNVSGQLLKSVFTDVSNSVGFTSTTTDYVNGSVATVNTLFDNGNRIMVNNIAGGTMTGGAGNDSFTGAVGADTFVFAPSGGRDYISNFQNGTDKLDLHAFGFTDFAQARSGIQGGVDWVYLTLGSGETATHLTINGVGLATFDQSDVIL